MRRAAALLATLALLALPATALAQEDFSADLTGGAEVPPVTTDGTGSATVTISDDESSISFDVTFQDLTGPALMAHIHYGGADAAGPVMIWLTEVGVTDGSYDSPISGTADETAFTPVDGGPQTFAEALQAIRDGNSYVNVHTETNMGGEIRGQLAASGQEDPELPDSSTLPAGGTQPLPLSPVGLLLALTGAAAAFAFGLYRFSFRRT